MKTLSTEHRRQLERTVVEARDIAEAGARDALEALAVHHHEPYGHMGGERRTCAIACGRTHATDAEWIGVCSASGEHAEMPLEAQGSIDIPEIRDQVANILEGGREAFMQRKEKYGFDY